MIATKNITACGIIGCGNKQRIIKMSDKFYDWYKIQEADKTFSHLGTREIAFISFEAGRNISIPMDAEVIVKLADIKEEFAERFVPKIIRGKTFQYDWDDQDLENWEWFRKILKSKFSE